MIRELGWPITRAEILEQHLGRTEEEVTANIARVLGRSVPDGFAEERQAAYAQVFTSSLTASGVTAARAAGMCVIGYAGLTPSDYLGGADEVVDNIADLVTAVERLSSPA